MKAKSFFKGPGIWIVVVVALLLVAFATLAPGGSSRIDTDKGLELLAEGGKVEQAKIFDAENRVDLVLKDNLVIDGQDKGKNVQFFYVNPRGADVVKAVTNAKPSKGFTDQPVENNWFSGLFSLLVPVLLLGVLFWFLLSRMQGGGSKVMQFGKSRAKMISKDMPQVTFADVAGADEAVEELQEIKEFLAEPGKFQAVGAKIPKGVLLFGPPGTGKTLLARAVAGEAGVPFFSISGSDFVEMFVGVGASRVRDLFEQAKANSPAIIFVDEIDAVGRHRGAGIGGGNDEREQTLNQMLVEMDGFDAKTNVIMIAATNRPDILDPALLRPGRFDRQISVDAPDRLGREHILQVHAKGKPLAPGVDLNAVAKKTPGYTGADLANVLNEAALLTARSNAQLIDDRALDEGIDRVMGGPQKRSRVQKEHDRKLTAYHEGGHALVAAALHNAPPVTKVTILPRGRAGGYTMVVPDEDPQGYTRNELLDRMAWAMGGRVAEEIVFHDPTTGASNDIEQATSTARRMVTDLGMSEKVGTIKVSGGDSDPLTGRGGNGSAPIISNQLAALIDDEVRRLLDEAHDEAYQILTENRDILDQIALELLERETINQSDVERLTAGVRKPVVRPIWLSKETRPVQHIAPVLSSRERAQLAAEAAARAAAGEDGEGELLPPALAHPAAERPYDSGVPGHESQRPAGHTEPEAGTDVVHRG
ncbi:ATP-dependent zinc metalloprotease FtsH [Arthrobacter cupressi]|uniref:ATP-dependent zinc metalloprotease FtsH n=1 Tax=Arthrobacter cupressi TaxID=1045773 RepID=A0A1G8QLW0_9MICC|nr:ATP-dependent zinc metalloprotease FtsH [Arthrobacter cupressi]NYD78186.1 cell division protease FtsH [Arthrobacter cupressi]SDJ05656.1 cell division protease FtsH [Arthrobacter cupressi]